MYRGNGIFIMLTPSGQSYIIFLFKFIMLPCNTDVIYKYNVMKLRTKHVISLAAYVSGTFFFPTSRFLASYYVGEPLVMFLLLFLH